MNLEAQSVALGAGTTPTASTVASQAPDTPPFEQILQELEALVIQLESGDQPLDEALRSFERGVRLTRECQAALTAAQQKVQLLLQRGESVVLEEFDRGAVESASVSAAGGEPALDP